MTFEYTDADIYNANFQQIVTWAPSLGITVDGSEIEHGGI